VIVADASAVTDLLLEPFRSASAHIETFRDE